MVTPGFSVRGTDTFFHHVVFVYLFFYLSWLQLFDNQIVTKECFMLENKYRAVVFNCVYSITYKSINNFAGLTLLNWV